MTMLPDPSAAAPRWLLVAGLALGATLGAFGLAAAPDTALPAGAVARVNERLILRDAWLRAVAAVAAERRAPLTDADQRRILDRLIDEELLVQHGLALGLAERDPRLRSTLVSEVMLAASRAAASEPDEAAQRAFYAEQRDFFAPAPRLHVRAWRLDADGQRQPFQPEVPAALLPAAKLATYLGPGLATQAARLAPGQPTEFDAADGRVVLELVEHVPAAAPPFEAIREEVRVEMRRRADEAAVRALLADLRGRTEVVVAPER